MPCIAVRNAEMITQNISVAAGRSITFWPSELSPDSSAERMAESFRDTDVSENLDDSSSEADSLSSFFERFTFRGFDADTALKLKKRSASEVYCGMPSACRGLFALKIVLILYIAVRCPRRNLSYHAD